MDQKNYYQVQVSEYTEKIKSNSDWEFVRIYADDGISGTDTKKREGFNEMMRDAREHKFDFLITKSVSRFARSTITTVQSIRELKMLGIYVKFETEGVTTDDP
ncbi:MAG TPA: recombinase family protein [Bacilli bacterium]|nr:recombinase family protein [Bacilli bacterium]